MQTIRELFNRLTGALPHPVESEVVEVAAATDSPENDRVGWVSPDYVNSRHVSLDLNQMLSNCVVAYQGYSPEMEQYRILRTRILHRTNNSGGGKIVMVTSSIPGEGKSLTSINLALTFAKDYNHSVLLLDCDLKRQSIHKILGFDSDRGIAENLLYGCPLADLIVWPGVEKLTIISGGHKVAASSELIGSPNMRHLISELRDRYPDRYVFLDAPPVLAGADAMALAPLVDHILYVVRARSTPLPEIRKSLNFLPKEKILGLIFNRQPAGQIIPYYHGYLGPPDKGSAAKR